MTDLDCDAKTASENGSRCACPLSTIGELLWYFEDYTSIFNHPVCVNDDRAVDAGEATHCFEVDVRCME